MAINSEYGAPSEGNLLVPFSFSFVACGLTPFRPHLTTFLKLVCQGARVADPQPHIDLYHVGPSFSL